MELQIVCDEVQILLYELIKYAYYRLDDKKTKSVISYIMETCEELPFLLDAEHNFNGESYVNIIHSGIEYDKFFSTASLEHFYGENVSDVSSSLLYDHYLRTPMYHTFKVMMHRRMSRTLRYNKKDYRILEELINSIYHNCDDNYVKGNILWTFEFLRITQHLDKPHVFLTREVPTYFIPTPIIHSICINCLLLFLNVL